LPRKRPTLPPGLRPRQAPRAPRSGRCRAPKLTAILATTDLLAHGAIQAAHERDLPVPAAMSVVGFDDLPDAASTGLTTVHQPLADKGRIAARLLLQALDGAITPTSHVELPTRLIVRGSTAQPPNQQ
jgi:LacI family transcriptional regulator